MTNDGSPGISIVPGKLRGEDRRTIREAIMTVRALDHI